jgi:hypothetical protein
MSEMSRIRTLLVEPIDKRPAQITPLDVINVTEL